MISVIIPIYNSEKYLDKLFECLKKQTYTNFEILMIDDGSADKSGEKCKEIMNEDSRFKYFYQTNSGVSVARNKGMQVARGEFITFIDSDDQVDSNYLDTLHNVCLDSDIAICNVLVKIKDQITSSFSMNECTLESIDALNLVLMRKNINSGPYAKMFRRSILCAISFPELTAYEDILFVIEAFSKAKSISVTDKTSYYYIENENSAMHKFHKEPSKDIVVASDRILDFIDQKSFDAACIYTTLSHLFQYVFACVEMKNTHKFIRCTQSLFKKRIRTILNCDAIPWKEKVVFILFVFGIVYKDRKFSWVGF